MKKLIPLLVTMSVILLAWSFFAPAHAQDLAKEEEKPTFYRLAPGVYVNGWPRFTITYPKDWVEFRPQPQVVFRAGAPDFSEMVTIDVGPLFPLDKLADILVSAFKNIAKDVTVVSDKPSQLRDGTPAREIEIKMIMNDLPTNYFYLATKKGDVRVSTAVRSFRVIREDLKAIPYSLQFEQGKDEPVRVPPDIQEFLDGWCSDIVSHDVAKVMTHYSDRILDSGTRKGGLEPFFRGFIGRITSFEVGITEFVLEGDRAYLAGFAIVNGGKMQSLEGTSIPKEQLRGTSIIKENGEWKWYGNQRDVSP